MIEVYLIICMAIYIIVEQIIKRFWEYWYEQRKFVRTSPWLGMKMASKFIAQYLLTH